MGYGKNIAATSGRTGLETQSDEFRYLGRNIIEDKSLKNYSNFNLNSAWKEKIIMKLW